MSDETLPAQGPVDVLVGRARYIVDRRVGEVCVRDTAHPDYVEGGCLSGSPATVKKWNGKTYKKMQPPYYTVWYVPHAAVMAAERLCARLNATPNAN